MPRGRLDRKAVTIGSTLLVTMRYLHTMLRVRDLDAALDFFVVKLGLRERRREQNEAGRFTLVFLGTGADGDGGRDRADLQLGPERALPDRAILWPPRLRGRRHLRDLRAAARRGRRHPAPAARRPHGLHQIARRPLRRAPAARPGVAAPGAVGVDAQPGELVDRRSHRLAFRIAANWFGRGRHMRLSDANLRGRTVIAADGQIVGEVSALFLDSEAWSIDALQVELRRETADQLGASRSCFAPARSRFPSA